MAKTKNQRTLDQSLRRLGKGFIPAGFLILLGGFGHAVITAGVPYPDAPPDIQAAYQLSLDIGFAIALTGLVLLVGGIVFYASGRAMRGKNTHETGSR